MNSAVDIWKKVQEIMSEDLTATAMSTWFDDCTAVDILNNCLYLHSPSSYKKEVIETRFNGQVNSALKELFSSDFDFAVLDDAGLTSLKESLRESDSTNLDNYTFEHFVVGSTNKFAHAAALAVASGKQKQNYNPLFIYGESGLGKTHLLHAIKQQVLSDNPNYNVVLVKGEHFTNELVQAIQYKQNVEFRDKYRTADFFLIDDIQFIAGKMSAQEEFFNTFNTLHELGRQIVFTSDRPPSDIHKLENRLKTRFESGLMTDIQPPDDALRVAIIKNKATQLGVVLIDEVTELIADNITSSIRQLEGAVKMIVAYRDIMEEEISVENVLKRLKDMFNNPKEQRPIADVIISETANYFMLNPTDLTGQQRTRGITNARHIAMFLIRQFTNLSFKETGTLFGGRDHSTVITSVRRIEDLIKTDTDLYKTIKDITSNINSKS